LNRRRFKWQLVLDLGEGAHLQRRVAAHLRIAARLRVAVHLNPVLPKEISHYSIQLNVFRNGGSVKLIESQRLRQYPISTGLLTSQVNSVL
jgi:hypothetical protein